MALTHRRRVRWGTAIAVALLARPAVHAEPATPSKGAAPTGSDGRAATPRAGRMRDALGEALRLAEALHDEDALFRLYARKAQSRAATPATLESLVASSESRGVPERAIAILGKRIRSGADDGFSAKLLAGLLTRVGRARDAAAAWGKVSALRGPTGLTREEAVAYARVLSRVDETEPAWKVLVAADTPSDDDRAYWSARAELAWQLSRDADCERAYQAAWKLGEHAPEARQRLAVLSRHHADVAEVARLAKASFAETHDPAELIEAGTVEFEAGQWKDLGGTLALADGEGSRFANLAPYWALRARWLGHSGRWAEALDAWDQALSHDASRSLAGEYLWAVLAFRQKSAILRAVGRIRVLGLEDAAEVRSPLALALGELGRSQEALRLWSQEGDELDLLDHAAYPLATALAATGRLEEAARVRRRAEQQAIANRQPIALDTVEGRERFVQVAEALGSARGPETQARWMRLVLARKLESGAEAAHPELVARLRELEGRTAAARALWLQASHAPDLEAEARERMLHHALVENDRPFLRAALANSPGYPNEALIEAALRLDDPVAAHEHLELAPATDGDEERADVVRTLASLDERRASRLAAGATYENIGPVVDFGPDVAGSFTWHDLRLGVDASARTLSTPNDPKGLIPGTREAEALLGWRSAGDRSSSELSAGGSYHPAGNLFRARGAHERWLAPWFLLSLRAGVNERIDDAPVLRALAAATYGSITARFESQLFYASVAGKLREDLSRRAAPLAREVSEESETGVRVVRGRPEVDFGVRLYAQQRENATSFPPSIRGYWPDSSLSPQSQLPPSYAFATLVARVAHGDLGERHSLAGAPWPRYECGLESGWRLPKREVATGGQCALGIRLGSAGTVTASARYGWGLFAIAQASSTRVSLTYDQRF